jgi:hypothetical protein
MILENEDFRLFDKEKQKDRFEIRTKVVNPEISQEVFNLFIKRFNAIYNNDIDVLEDDQFNVKRYRTNQRGSTDDYDFICIIFDLKGWDNISIESFYSFYEIEGFKINDFVIKWGEMHILYTWENTIFTNIDGNTKEFTIDMQ